MLTGHQDYPILMSCIVDWGLYKTLSQGHTSNEALESSEQGCCRSHQQGRRWRTKAQLSIALLQIHDVVVIFMCTAQ